MNSTTFQQFTVSIWMSALKRIISYVGYQDCKFPCDVQDYNFCKQYSAPKPAPAKIEFLEVFNILLEENDWYIPTNSEESLTLFLNLITEIENLQN